MLMAMVYVTEFCNERVQKFTPEGKLLAVIDSKGSKEEVGWTNHRICVSMLMTYTLCD